MRSAQLAIVLLALAFSTPRLSAVTVTTQPPAPTAGVPVTLVIFHECPPCARLGPPVINGFTIDIPLLELPTGCPAACFPITFTLDLEALPAGSYTVRFVDTVGAEPEPVALGGFIVGEGRGVPVPTLGGWGAVALVLLLTAAALRRLRGA